MRVIRGIYRSRRLVSPKVSVANRSSAAPKSHSAPLGARKNQPPGNEIRPTADMVKQAMFNMLAVKVQEARVLELFAGTGQLGIEALSCGAESVVFVDNAQESCALVRQNLQTLQAVGEVIQSDWSTGLDRLSGRCFDIILADPPYGAGLYEAVQQKVLQTGLLHPDGWLVLEYDRALPPAVLPGFIQRSNKQHGRRCLMILEPAK